MPRYCYIAGAARLAAKYERGAESIDITLSEYWQSSRPTMLPGVTRVRVVLYERCSGPPCFPRPIQNPVQVLQRPAREKKSGKIHVQIQKVDYLGQIQESRGAERNYLMIVQR